MTTNEYWSIYPKKSVVNSKARITSVADIINGEFQGHYAPFTTDQQRHSVNSQQVKGETIVQNIIPIHVMPTPQV